MFLQRLKAVFLPVLTFAVATLVMLSLSRLALMTWLWDRVEAVDGLGFILIQGLRFDIIIVCALAVLPAIVMPLLANQKYWLKLLQGYLLAAFGLVLFLESTTPGFIIQYDQRPNILFVEYLKYPKEVGAMLLQGYKLEIFFSTLIVGLGVFFFNRTLKSSLTPQPRFNLISCAFSAVIVILICVMGIRSTLGHRPVNPSKVAFSSDLLANDLALSSMYRVLYAIYNSNRYGKSVRAYGRMDSDIAIAEVKNVMAIDESLYVSSELPTLHIPVKPSNADKNKKPLNLVIVLEESLGAEFVGALGGVGVTPEIDKLTKQGIWFDNLYATGTRSVRGIEAVITGFTPTPARSVVKQAKAQSGFFSIAEVLKRRGYDTSFIYGGEAHFDNMRQFFMGNGFQRIVEEKDYVNPVFKGSWGVSDEDVFNRAHEEFEAMNQKAEKPFFSLVFSSSNHDPFEYPEGRIELHDETKATVNNAVKYADFALGEFFEKAKKSSYWDNTIFLVVADHNSRVRGTNLVPIKYFHIPAMILGGGIEPQVYSRMASQIDLIPTLLGMMDIDDAIPATGYDLFRDDIASIPGRAIMQYNEVQAYMQEDKVVVMQMGKEPGSYDYADETLTPAAQPYEELKKRALAFSIWSAMAYQQQLYRLPKQNIKKLADVD